jgi:large subunit ribosomal protein L6
MSRIGKIPVSIPEKVSVTIDSKSISIKGPKGELQTPNSEFVTIKQEENCIKVSPSGNSRKSKEFFGMYRAMVQNMVQGVSVGFEKKLELKGVGYRSQVQGTDLILNVGYSHQVKIPAPAGIKFLAEGNTNITVSGIDKQLVGQIAADIRSSRPPEPYNGKGITYQGEIIRRKAGKTGKK